MSGGFLEEALEGGGDGKDAAHRTGGAEAAQEAEDGVLREDGELADEIASGLALDEDDSPCFPPRGVVEWGCWRLPGEVRLRHSA